MNEFKSKFQFKTDKASVDVALAHLVEKCKQIKRTDKESIAWAIHVSAMEFDVDSGALEDAWAQLAPQTFAN